MAGCTVDEKPPLIIQMGPGSLVALGPITLQTLTGQTMNNAVNIDYLRRSFQRREDDAVTAAKRAEATVIAKSTGMAGVNSGNALVLMNDALFEIYQDSVRRFARFLYAAANDNDEAIAGLLNEACEAELDPARQVAITDLVDVIRDELSKGDPDQSKLQRWGVRLLGLLREFSLHAAAGGLVHLFSSLPAQ
jgi:hypothetical protein